MTWSLRDSLVKASSMERGKIAEKVESDRAPVVAPAVPAKVPTYAQNAEYRQLTDDETPFTFTRAQERELIEEGLWPDRQWTIWRHAMTRGIDAY